MTQEHQFLNAFEDKDRGVLVFLFRDDSGLLRKKEVAAPYTAFIHTQSLDQDTRQSLYRACGNGLPIKKITEQGSYTRIDWRSWNDRQAAVKAGGPFIQRNIQTFEGDVSALRRFLSDNTVHIAKPKAGYLDIETDSRVPFDRKEETRILSWCLCDENEEVVESGVLESDTDEAESRLVQSFWKAAEKYDQLIAWNGDFFDFIVLQARAKFHKLGVKFRRWLYLDQLVLFKRMNAHASESGEEKQSYKLNDIAQAVLGDKKDEFNSKYTWQAWAKGGHDREQLVKYNIKDTLLLCRLERKTGYIKLFQTLCEVSHGFCETSFLNPTRQLDGYMLKLGSQKGIHFPTRLFDDNDDDNDDDPYKGAFVHHPNPNGGILKGVHVCDFASLYPSIMLTWNMSPETKEKLDGNYCTSPSTRVRFANTQGAILPTALRELMQLRKAWNEKKSNSIPGTPDWYDADRRSNAYKVAANSFYGVVGSAYSRYYDRQIAESVTQNGQWLIKKTMEQCFIRGWHTVYGDTDSVFITGCTEQEFKDFTQWCNNEFYPNILKECNCAENHIKLAYEKEFDWLVFTSAKRYVGIYTHYKGKRATKDSKPEVKGLEYKRGDTLQLARKLQEDTIKLFCGKIDDPLYYLKVVESCLYKVLNENLTLDQVKISKGMSKPLHEYSEKGMPAHIRIAKIMKERGEQIGAGTRIEYVVVDSSTSPKTVIPAEDWTGDYDKFHLWENLIYPPSFRLLCAIFPDKKHLFEKYETVRPKKTRGESARQKKEANGQASLFPEITSQKRPSPVDLSGVVLVAPNRSRTGPYVIKVEERHTRSLGALKTILESSPGTRPIVLECVLKSGVVIMDLPLTVAVTPKLKHQVETLLNGDQENAQA